MTRLSPLVPRRVKELMTEHANLKDRVRDLEAQTRELKSDIGELRSAVETYRAELAYTGGHEPHSLINQHERRVYSQNGEDGILDFIFERIGATDKRFVEFGIQDGRECNTANLSLNQGWSGLLMELDPEFAESARTFYDEKLGQRAGDVRIRCAKVTPDNINQLLREEGFEGPIDLLSIDIDGNDLWVWEAIEAIAPRVVVIEYNASFGPTRSVSVPYDPDFYDRAKHPSAFYHGASLTALAKSGRKRGYLLAGCDTRGVNAFFVEASAEAGSGLGEMAPAVAFYAQDRRRLFSADEQFELISDLELIEV